MRDGPVNKRHPSHPPGQRRHRCTMKAPQNRPHRKLLYPKSRHRDDAHSLARELGSFGGQQQQQQQCRRKRKFDEGQQRRRRRKQHGRLLDGVVRRHVRGRSSWLGGGGGRIPCRGCCGRPLVCHADSGAFGDVRGSRGNCFLQLQPIYHHPCFDSLLSVFIGTEQSRSPVSRRPHGQRGEPKLKVNRSASSKARGRRRARPDVLVRARPLVAREL